MSMLYKTKKKPTSKGAFETPKYLHMYNKKIKNKTEL